MTNLLVGLRVIHNKAWLASDQVLEVYVKQLFFKESKPWTHTKCNYAKAVDETNDQQQ